MLSDWAIVHLRQLFYGYLEINCPEDYCFGVLAVSIYRKVYKYMHAGAYIFSPSLLITYNIYYYYYYYYQGTSIGICSSPISYPTWLFHDWYT
jgi:hypothetical protein